MKAGEEVRRAISAHLSRLRAPFVALGDLPTPIERLEAVEEAAGLRSPLYVKRDDRSAAIYGGNKIRTLEVLFGHAKARGKARIWATGAYGSNHAVATVLHAPRAGLSPGAILFPQPASFAALENLSALLAERPALLPLPHWSALPFGMAYVRYRDRREGPGADLMVPGGATPMGALGYVSAAFEVAEQVAAGVTPAPRAIVVGVGSTCTSAGLLLGLRLAARRGLGFVRPPLLVSVRVTPWPVTAPFRVLGLAERTAAYLAEQAGEPAPSRAELKEGLRVDGRYLGRGYGYATPKGEEAIALFDRGGGPPLDTTYSGKSAACALDLAREAGGPVLYWATKSSAPMPELPEAPPPWTPEPMRRWFREARASY